MMLMFEMYWMESAAVLWWGMVDDVDVVFLCLNGYVEGGVVHNWMVY